MRGLGYRLYRVSPRRLHLRRRQQQFIPRRHPTGFPVRNQYPNYECGQCPFKNLDKSLLVRHLKNDHGIEVDPDSIPDAPNRGVVLIPVPGDIREMGLVDREERLRAWWGAVKVTPLNPVDAGLLMKRLSFMYGEHYPAV